MAPDAATVNALKFVCANAEHICRLCFASTEADEYFLDDMVTFDKVFLQDTVNYSAMFHELGVQMDAHLPQVLCAECSNTIINTYLFRKLCQYSNETWMKALTQLEKGLSETDMITPQTATAYILLNQEKHIMYLSKKAPPTKNIKQTVLQRIQNAVKTKTKKKKEPNLNTCPVCKEKCSMKQLYKHREMHKLSRIICQQCGREFAHASALQNHKARVHSSKHIQCSKCNKKLSTEQTLREHEYIYHTAVVCKTCSKPLPSRKDLKVHMETHASHMCPNCSKQLLTSVTLKQHMGVCGTERQRGPQVFCDICNKGYVGKNGLRSHLKVVHGFGANYTCPWCDKKFVAKSSLECHVLKHTRERNFSCEYCGGKFVTQAALIYHTRLHTGEKPYHCDMCDESFLSASRRAAHKKRKHLAPSEVCPYCDAKFVTGFSLRKHMSRHTNPHSKLYMPIMVTEKQVDPANVMDLDIF